MKKMLFGLLIALTSMAATATTWLYKDDTVSVFINDSVRCQNERILQLLKLAEVNEKWVFGEAYVLFQGRKIAACVAIVGDKVVLVDEEGDGGSIPLSAFKPLKDV